jgi:hypothetical protein
MSVYFAKVGRYLKIGYSENPERRVRNLWRSTTRYGRPWDLSINETPRLLLAVDGDKHDEQQIHAALDDFYACLEWFIDEPPVRDFMREVENGASGCYLPMPRPGGPFVPVPHEQMLPERYEEIQRLTERSRRKHAKRGAA